MTAILSALTVDTVAMRQLAARIRQVAAEADLGADGPGALSPLVAALGPPVLVQATGVFIDRWGGALADLVDDAHRLADAIDLAARSYQDADSLTERGFLG
jgi:hypothetical protein